MDTLSKIIEMNKVAKSFCLARFGRYSYDPPEVQNAVSIELKLESDSGDKLEILCRGQLIEAVDEAYARVTRFLGRNPEFDPNKTIEYQGEKETRVPVGESQDGDRIPVADDGVPF